MLENPVSPGINQENPLQKRVEAVIGRLDLDIKPEDVMAALDQLTLAFRQFGGMNHFSGEQIALAMELTTLVGFQPKQAFISAFLSDFEPKLLRITMRGGFSRYPLASLNLGRVDSKGILEVNRTGQLHPFRVVSQLNFARIDYAPQLDFPGFDPTGIQLRSTTFNELYRTAPADLCQYLHLPIEQ